MKKTLLLAFMFILAGLMTPAVAEDEAAQGDAFRPTTEVGLVFDGTMTAEGQCKLQAGVRMFSGSYDFDFFSHTEYRQQQMAVNDFDMASAAVQYYSKASYVGSRMNKKVEMEPELEAKKIFIRFGEPPAVLPRPLNTIGLTMASLSFDDPFAIVLPEKALRKDLEWEPNPGNIERLLFRVGVLMGELPKKEDPNKKNNSGVEMERGGRPGGRGDWGDRDQWAGPRSLVPKVTRAWGRIIDFSMKEFTGEVGFEGVLTMDVWRQGQLEIPFSGLMEFTYDLEKKSITKGDLGSDCVFDGKIELGPTQVPVKIDWRQKMRIERKYGEVYNKAKAINVPATIYAAPSPTTPLLVSYVDGDKVFIAQNWDGTEVWEGLNCCKPLDGITSEGFVAGNSSDGRYMLVSDGKNVLWSDDYGNSFTAVTWRGQPIVGIDFLNSPNSTALLKLANDEYVLVDAKSKALKTKKIVAPTAGKKLLAACSGGIEGSMVRADTDDCDYAEGDERPKRLGNSALKGTEWLQRSPRGVYAINANGLFLINSMGAVKIDIPNLPKNISAIAESDKELFILADGVVWRAPIAGGEAASFMQGIRSIAFQRGWLFTADASGVKFAVRAVPTVAPDVK
ncbi:MAG: hypothetical protein Kow00107_03460 [Planctomycetota bacterium]